MRHHLSVLLINFVVLAAASSVVATEDHDAVFPVIQSLDGEWRIAKDPTDTGKTNFWFSADHFPVNDSKAIQVPGNIYEALPYYKGLTWYSRTFTATAIASSDLRAYLRFGAVGYYCEVWLNGVLLGEHEGALSPFEFDATAALLPGQLNRVTLRVRNTGVAFSGGINQHVSVVTQPIVRIKDIFAITDIKSGDLNVHIAIENNCPAAVDVELSVECSEYTTGYRRSDVRTTIKVPTGASTQILTTKIKDPQLWNLDDPFLYKLHAVLVWNMKHDEQTVRFAYRDFRIVDGWFELNGKRIFLKSCHASVIDPLVIQGTPRHMTYLAQDCKLLKSAGFNMLRFIMYSALPEQLDLADELGFLIYDEHESSWQLQDPAKFGISIREVMRRDRNHPSLVMWGLLNETPAGQAYDNAKAILPELRKIDDTRVVMLSSGRWDKDFKTGSASNPGASTFNVYMGGEDPVNPVPVGNLPSDIGAYFNGTGDAHVYQAYPITWEFMNAFAQIAKSPKPLFISEAGIGSAYNPISELRKLDAANAPANAYARSWVTPAIEGLQKAWSKYDLNPLYPKLEDMLIDSALNTARQRELMFNLIRGNPKVNGYNLTSMADCWGAGEGIMDSFREFKPGHLPVLKAGWSRARWCLIANPMNVYTDQRLHIKVSLANEDFLPPGQYAGELALSGPKGIAWKKTVNFAIEKGPHAPFAYQIQDEDIPALNGEEGSYDLTATLLQSENPTSNTLRISMLKRDNHPGKLGAITVLGIDRDIRELLLSRGATLRDFAPGESISNECILIGSGVGDAAAWRSLYGRIAKGAQAIFLDPTVFVDKGVNRWIPLAEKGDQYGEFDWLYHKDLIAKKHPIFNGLQSKIMTPDFYGSILSDTKYFRNITPPNDTSCVAINCTYYKSGFEFGEGVMIGTYTHHAGKFTINGLNLVKNVGNPAADRLILNLIANAKVGAPAVSALPENYDAELDRYGIK